MRSNGIARGRGIIAVLLITMGLLAGCGGNNSTPGVPGDAELEQTAIADETVGSSGSAALPIDDFVDPAEIMARRGSAYAQSTLTGLEFTCRSTGTMPGPESLLLAPGAAPGAWAMYSFADNLAADTPLMLTVELTPALPSCLFLAIADYGSESWHWLSFDDPGPGINLVFPAEVQPVSPGGRINVLLLVEAEENASITGLTLHRNVVAPPPANLSTNYDDPRPDLISLGWDDPAVTHPGLSYDAVRIERRTNFFEGWDLLADVPIGQTGYDDVWSTENTIPYDVDVSYRIRTVAGDTAGLPSTPVTGRRLLQDVTIFAASDGDYPDRVHITWDPVPGAESYELESQNVSSGGGWTLVTSDLNTEYDYYWDEFPEYPMGFGEYYGCYVRVRACWQGLATESMMDYGYRGLPDITNVQATDGVYPGKVVVTWDPVPGADGYEVGYYAHLGGFGELDYTEEVGDVTSWEHTGQGWMGDLYDHIYTYEVKPSWHGLTDDYYHSGKFQDDGHRLLRPPLNLTATDDLYADRISLTWDKAQGATGYRIYRDGVIESDLVATVGDVDTWDDLGLSDRDIHSYWLRSTWTERISEFSELDQGSISLFDVHVLGFSGRDLNLEMVDSKPAVVFTGEDYYHDVEGVYYARSATATPSSAADWSYHLVAACDDLHAEPSACVVDGKPVLAYTDNDLSACYYARAVSATPDQASDWEVSMLYDDGYGISHVYLAEINGLPAAAINRWGHLKYAYTGSMTPTGSADWTITEIDAFGHGEATLIEQDNLPIFLFGTSPGFATTTTTAPTGPTDWNIHLLDSDAEAWEVSMVLAGGIPYTCFANGMSNRLEFARALGPNPASSTDWVSHEVNSSMSHQPDDCEVGIIDGMPVICYTGQFLSGGEILRYAMARESEPSGEMDWEIRRINLLNGVRASELTMLVRDNKPYICCNSASRSKVWYATLRD